MALSEDQKAILRLLAQRGEQGYADLAALMGIGVGEVHAKAQEAAAALEAEGIPPPAIPPPPAGASAEKAPAPEERKPPPEPKPAPAPPPQPIEEKRAPEPAAAKPAVSPRSGFALPSGKGARAGIAASALVVVGFVLILLLAGGDSGSDDTSATTTGSEAGSDLPVAGGKSVTKAILEPVEGGSGSGVAIFGRVKNSVVLQIAAEGLEPTPDGQTYTVWLSQSPRKMLPLVTTRVTGNGRIAASTEVPIEVLGYLASETFKDIAVTRTDAGRLQASLKAATSKKEAPDYTGAEVLRGTVTGPIVGAAKRQGEAE